MSQINSFNGGAALPGNGVSRDDIKSLTMLHYPPTTSAPASEMYSPLVGATIRSYNLRIMSGNSLLAEYDPLSGFTSVDIGEISSGSQWLRLQPGDAVRAADKDYPTVSIPAIREAGNVPVDSIPSGVYFGSGTLTVQPLVQTGDELRGTAKFSIGLGSSQEFPLRLQDSRKSSVSFSGLVASSGGSLSQITVAFDGLDTAGRYLVRLESFSLFKITGISGGGGSVGDIDAEQLFSLIDTIGPIQKKLDDAKEHVVIYQDPQEASPLTRLDTPALDIIKDSSSAAQGGGSGNGWTSVDMHLFSITNYFVPVVDEDLFEYIVTQPQSGSVYNHQVAIYELDREQRQLHLVCMSGNLVSLDGTTGVKSAPVKYISPEYNTVKPSKLYYAAHFCDQPALHVGGFTANTFNLNPSSSETPLGIWKSNVGNVSQASGYELDPETVKTLQLSGFGMTAERHYLSMRHQ